ncbi:MULTISPECIES: LytR/AlgR family response regulator transcription factor [Sphingobacterium]|uniref:LytTR family DNA-binding domain-containing protein n=1 Tax=Sphingobacterium ginsenosidimutans TaxID=687845 RepID=A0ABP7ZSY0_9SPHI|nr:LytTR family DNA-binding domain-containing protein [Sphingobacterium sp. E70]ULT24304.1 LytTR family DNA-binding domain-containing protein [Sphingobacterium sp. E70]
MNERLRCIVVDDEEGAHLVLHHYIKDIKKLDLKASFYHPVEAMDYMYDHEVDLIFLDINMPGLNGLEMLRALSNPPLVILTTAYKEYALESYEYRVVDYLVKPFDIRRFMSAIDNVFSRYPSVRPTILDHPVVLATAAASSVVVKVDGDFVRIMCKDIIYIQSWGNYVKIFTTSGSFVSSLTTAEMEQKLDKDLFMRIHKSHIVSLERVSKISGGSAELDSGEKLPIGSTYRRELLLYFQK